MASRDWAKMKAGWKKVKILRGQGKFKEANRIVGSLNRQYQFVKFKSKVGRLFKKK